jgi:phosphonate transport system substrate-binding protein
MSRLINIFRVGQFLLACCAFGLGCTSAGAAEKNSYTLGVMPNLPAVTLHKSWTPFVEQLSRELGIKIELKLYDKLATFLDETKAGQPDFIYSAPNTFYLAYQKQKYIPLVRSSNLFRGRVFVRKDSPYTTISELRGKSIAFAGPMNVCSVITRQAMLSNLGELDFNSTFSGSAINVAKSVLLGKVDAGAALDTSMMNDLPEMANEFRILMETEKIAPHPLAAHPRVPKKIQLAFADAVMAMASSEQGRKMLEIVKLAKPVKAEFQRDYAFFSAFDFEHLDKQHGK